MSIKQHVSRGLDKVDDAFSALFNAMGEGWKVCKHDMVRDKDITFEPVYDTNYCNGKTSLVAAQTYYLSVCSKCGVEERTWLDYYELEDQTWMLKTWWNGLKNSMIKLKMQLRKSHV